jgi:hypothetical protein
MMSRRKMKIDQIASPLTNLIATIVAPITAQRMAMTAVAGVTGRTTSARRASLKLAG